MTKKITFSLLAILVSSCLLLTIGVIAGAIFLVRSQKNYIAPTIEPTEEPEVGAQMDRIQTEVSEIRGLSLQDPLQRDLMTSTDLQDTVVNDFFVDYSPEEARQDAALLSALGLLEPGFDLLQFYKDLYSEQIAGFYDSETKEMYVIADSDFGGVERMTYAHEFTHVLQDQTYDLENGLKLNDDHCEVETEYCTAVSALVEGDATLTEQYWFLTKSTDDDKNQVSDFQQEYESPVYDSAPAYMKEDFLFPYQKGFAFVNELFNKNLFQAVDDAYRNPPVSTEQILHPEKYPDEKPIPVTLPAIEETLGEGWQRVEQNVIGEWYTYLVLAEGIRPEMRLSHSDAESAAAGWGGDAYAYYNNPETGDEVLVWLSTWDSTEDAEEFYGASKTYAFQRWGTPRVEGENSITFPNMGGTAAIVRMENDQVLWVISNNEEAFIQALFNFNV